MLCVIFFLMGDGAVHGQVLAQWPQMFRILNMFGTGGSPHPFLCIITHIMACVSLAAARESSAAATNDDGAGVGPDADVPPGGRLVRVPIDELQHDIK